MGQTSYAGRIGKVLTILEANPAPMKCVDLADMLHTTPRIMSSVLWRCGNEKVPGFRRAEIDGQVLYAVGKGKLPETDTRSQYFTMPEDLWRGWTNPITGVTGVKLGL